MWLLIACTAAGSKSPADTATEDSADTSRTTTDSGTTDSGTTDSGTTDSDTSTSPGGREALLVSAYNDDHVHIYDRETGETVGSLAGVLGGQTTVLVDGVIVVAAELDNRVLRFDATTGAALPDLIADDPTTEEDETGGLDAPTAAVPGPDGRWYVASWNTGAILRYEADGTFVDTFLAAGTDGLDGPDNGVIFGPDGSLYVPGYYSNTVHRFDADGTPLSPILTASDGIDRPRTIRFDSAGAAWVSAYGSGQVWRVDTDGTKALVVDVRQPTGFDLDEDRGEILLGLDSFNTVKAFDLESGEAAGVIVDDPDLAAITYVTRIPDWEPA